MNQEQMNDPDLMNGLFHEQQLKIIKQMEEYNLNF